MFDLSGMTALVTGASGGIGSAIAKALSGQGARLALSGSNADKLAAFAGELGGDHATLACDLSDGGAVDALVPSAVEALGGKLDILVNNAGITRDNLAMRMKDEEWDAVIRVHLKGHAALSRAAAVHWRAAGKASEDGKVYGRVINTSSEAFLFGAAGQPNYSAAKAGIQGFTKTLALELGRFGITANTIAPGFIETDMTRATAERMGISFEDMTKQYLSMIPVGRTGKPEDIAHAASFFASEGAGYVSGQTMYVAGGPLG